MEILVGDCREVLKSLAPASVQCCITSPPYFGLRDYQTGSWDGGDPECDHQAGSDYGSKSDTDHKGQIRGGPFRDTCRRCGARRVDEQIGLEQTPEEFVEDLVDVFREVRRVLRDDGTLWLNLGDSYNAYNGNRGTESRYAGDRERIGEPQFPTGHGLMVPNLKQKDLIGIPWMVAFALRADGWYLRSDVIWAKPNPMPESVQDRPTSAHEHVFLLTKSPRYFYDVDAIREGASSTDDWIVGDGSGRNKRNVWEISTQPYAAAHFATFPTKLVEPCILAGTSPKACSDCGAPWRRVVERSETAYARVKRETGLTWREMAEGAQEVGKGLRAGQRTTGGTRLPNGTQPSYSGALPLSERWQPMCDHDDDSGRCVVLDPFAGSGTTGVVSAWFGREFVGIELNKEYANLARARIASDGVLGRSARRVADHAEAQLGLFDLKPP